MTTILSLMSEDHRHCDEVFATIEGAVLGGDWDAARARLTDFRDALLRHFAAEEALLFPGFERVTGITHGPTRVMRAEHAEMRGLLDRAAAALAAADGDNYVGEAETLLIMMQQHNMKEEGVLYPMCDQHLADDAMAGQLAAELTVAA